MKIAIIGGGIGGLLTTDHFNRLGAEVVLFAKEPLGGGVRRMLDIDPTISMEYPWKQLIPLDRTSDRPNRIPTIQEYQTLFLDPLIERIRSLGHWKNLSVARVHKRFLRTTENIQNNGSRLKDLFRVVYLQDELEYYEDFDIVIDASGVFRYPCPIGGGSSWAINEKRAEEKNSLFKSWDIFKTLQSDVPSSGLVVGSGAFAAHYCRLFFRTFKDQSLILVTDEKEPFEKLARGGIHPQLTKDIQDLMTKKYQQWKQQYLEYENKLTSWQELEPFEKAKTPKPVIPTAKLHIYAGYNVVSVDTLTDREGIFATIERPAFRGKEEPPKTLNVDHIIVATGFYKGNKNFLQGMRLAFQETGAGSLSKAGKHPEPGLYTLGTTDLAKNDRYEIPQIIEQIPLLEKNILSFFSRVS